MRTKVTAAQVVEIREAAARKERLNTIAARYGVAPTTVHMIVHGYNWPDVGGPIIPRGRRHRPDAQSKLTPHQIVTARLRYAAGETLLSIAEDYGVTIRHVQGYTSGQKGKNLPGPRTRKFQHLKPVEVENIRVMYDAGVYTRKQLAHLYQMSVHGIERIIWGQTYPNLPGPIHPPKKRTRTTT